MKKLVLPILAGLFIPGSLHGDPLELCYAPVFLGNGNISDYFCFNKDGALISVSDKKEPTVTGSPGTINNGEPPTLNLGGHMPPYKENEILLWRQGAMHSLGTLDLGR